MQWAGSEKCPMCSSFLQNEGTEDLNPRSKFCLWTAWGGASSSNKDLVPSSLVRVSQVVHRFTRAAKIN